jgi:MinD superfamily P-loop ATPase
VSELRSPDSPPAWDSVLPGEMPEVRSGDDQNSVGPGHRFVVAVASGKGGTGKTMVATALATTAGARGVRVTYADADVEEPNGHILLRPRFKTKSEVQVPVPEVDRALCDACGRCGDFCRYRAIAVLGDQPLTFPELCHGCGGCSLVCPRDAITESPKVVGWLEHGTAGPLQFIQGRLRVGEPMATPVVRAVGAALPEHGFVVVDVAPGTSCPVVEAVRGADVVLLVTDPTPFGIHDLELAVQMVKQLDQEALVVVNRVGPGLERLRRLCARERMAILAELPEDRRVAEAYAEGRLATEVPAFRVAFDTVTDELLRRAWLGGAVRD